MPIISRRQCLVAAAVSAGTLVLNRLQAVAASAKPVRITGIDSFPIRIPVSEEDRAIGKISGYMVARVDTDAGVRGYSFAGPAQACSIPRYARRWSGRICLHLSGICRRA